MVCSGNPVDKVEIQIVDAGSPQPQRGRFDVAYRLQPADRCLHKRIDVLHAETGPVDAEFP